MFYKGNLSNFYPPDLLAFLASSEQDGYLTVHPPEPLSITLKNGTVVDAFSPKGDSLLLRMLFLKKLITPLQIQIITKAKKETLLSCRQVLEQLDFFPLKAIEVELIQTIEEVIFQFFQKEAGLFQFTDTTIDDSNCITRLLPEELVLDITAKVDGWHEYLQSLGNLEQLVTLNPACQAPPASRAEEIITRMAQKTKTISQLISQAPLSDYVAAKAILNGVRQQLFILKPNEGQGIKTLAPLSPFAQYKKYLRKTIQAQTLRHKLEEVLHFCKNYFEYTAILSINKDLLERAVSFTKKVDGILHCEKITREHLSILEDLVMTTACRKGLAYFGKMQDSAFFKELFPEILGGECGILPFEIKGQHVKLLFVQTCLPHEGQTPLQYLELLSWLISPAHIAEPLPDDFGQDKIKKIIRLTDELPPMPHVAGKALEILNNPDNSWQKLSDVLEQDPSLLAMIIKVANSALYSSGQEITNLQTAVAKLGLTIIRSLVLTAATRTLFPADNPKFKELSTPLWRHVTGCGLTARIIAKAAGYPDPEEAFVGGLLHDIGKLAILLNYPDEYEKVQREAEKSSIPTHVLEKQLLGFDHTDIGQMLTSKWHMPKPLQTCVQYHHCPEEASGAYRQLAMIIHMADLQNHLSTTKEVDTESAMWLPLDFLYAELNIDEARRQTLSQEIQDSIQHIDSLAG